MAKTGDVASTTGAEELAPEVAAKEARLRAIIGGRGSVLVAYSGGVDSALLLKVTTEELGAQAVGALATSEAYD